MKHDVLRAGRQHDQSLAVLDAELARAVEHRLGGNSGIEESVRLDRALQILFVVDGLRGVGRRIVALERALHSDWHLQVHGPSSVRAACTLVRYAPPALDPRAELG